MTDPNETGGVFAAIATAKAIAEKAQGELAESKENTIQLAECLLQTAEGLLRMANLFRASRAGMVAWRQRAEAMQDALREIAQMRPGYTSVDLGRIGDDCEQCLDAIAIAHRALAATPRADGGETT